MKIFSITGCSRIAATILSSSPQFGQCSTSITNARLSNLAQPSRTGRRGAEFTSHSVGANAGRVKFRRSAIDHTQLNLFVQMTFSCTVGSFAGFGERLSAADAQTAFADSSANTLTLGLDNFKQIDPQGSNKATIQLADLQFAHDMSRSTYWYASLGVGYQGMPLYNHFIGGLGYRLDVTPNLRLHAQLGLGSGGCAPERIDTGAGLLV